MDGDCCDFIRNKVGKVNAPKSIIFSSNLVH
jgi:hypothetical protein